MKSTFTRLRQTYPTGRPSPGPQAAQRFLLPRLPGAAPHGGEGAHLCGAVGVRAGRFDPLSAVLARPIQGDWPYRCDRCYLREVRQNGRIVSVALIVAVGANTDGLREVLSMDIGPSGAETFWTAFLSKLVKLVISDAHGGIKATAAKCSTPLGSVARPPHA